MQLQKEVKSNPKQPSCKSDSLQKGYHEKRCEIQGDCQEMAVMAKSLITTKAKWQ